MTTLAEAYAAEGIKPPRQKEETDFQEAAISFLKRALPGVAVWAVDCVWPNDGSKKAQNILMRRRRRGILSGYPDVLVTTCPNVWFELKKPKGGVLSDAQLDRRDELVRGGHHWFGPVTTLEQIEACLLSIGMTLAASTGIKAEVPQIGKRRLANYAKLHDPVPDFRGS